MKYEKIFEPLRIGPCLLKNRLIRAPQVSRQALGSFEPSPQMLYRYGEESRGGAAMIIVEGTEVDGRHLRAPQLRSDSDFYLSGFVDLAEIIHVNGALACLQLSHPGMNSSDPVSPAGVPDLSGDGSRWLTGRVITKEEIEEVISLFADGAFRAKYAGFDMVEVHNGTGYMLQQFVSPHFNKRTDEWGGSFEGRIRLAMEIIRRIREKCGPGFPVGFKNPVDELLPDGLTFEEGKLFARRLEQAGAAYLRPQRGCHLTYLLGEGRFAMRSPKAGIVKYTELLKKEVGIPVLTNGQIHEPELMEEILARNQADALCIGRPLLADPAMPDKIRKGKPDDICMCIRCNHCFGSVARHRLTCTQNPASGRGEEYAIKPAGKKRNVLVVGGGPAGLEAARVAALRGHSVTLLEKEPELGGQIKVASRAIGKEHFIPYIIDWRARQCEQAGVEIKLGVAATPDKIKKYHADVVIVATGAGPLVPRIPGVDKKNVVTAVDVLQGKAKVGRRVVLAGGGLVGVETADFIAEKGLADEVTVIEMLPAVGADMSFFNLAYLTQKFKDYGVKLITGERIREITGIGVVTVDRAGVEKTVEADTVVLALGSVAENKLAQSLAGSVPDLYLIGDCKQPRKLIDAILEGAYIARHI